VAQLNLGALGGLGFSLYCQPGVLSARLQFKWMTGSGWRYNEGGSEQHEPFPVFLPYPPCQYAVDHVQQVLCSWLEAHSASVHEW